MTRRGSLSESRQAAGNRVAPSETPLPAQQRSARPQRGPQQRLAFTLLEIVLTLSLTVALMVLLGGAMQFYGRTMTMREVDIEQTQLASALLQLIEDDLRATLFFRTIDPAPLEAFLAASNGDPAPIDEDLSAAGIDSGTPLETEPEPAPIGSMVLQSPGLIGDPYQIQFDLSRLPRLEEYVAMLDGSLAELDDLPSDIKTVAYRLQSSGTLAGVKDALHGVTQPEPVGGGLVRRSLDRAATVEASLNGGWARLHQTGELIAPEVIALEFAYWDGITWLPEWNSDLAESLPWAVKVQLTMEDVTGAGPRTFTHIIRLPLASQSEAIEDPELAAAAP